VPAREDDLVNLGIRIPRSYIEALDTLVTLGFYKTRSDAIRAGIRKLLNEFFILFEAGEKVQKELPKAITSGKMRGVPRDLVEIQLLYQIYPQLQGIQDFMADFLATYGKLRVASRENPEKVKELEQRITEVLKK